MSTHLTRDLSVLHRNLLAMCTTVEELVHKAVDELSEPDIDRARELAKQDDEVDRFDVSIEEECLKILALHQPVAIDLRRIATVLKVNNDLERIADLAVNVAERAKALDDYPTYPIPAKLSRMATTASQMVRGSLDAFVTWTSVPRVD